MSKGTRTRQHIVAKAAAIFNTHGVSAAPISAILKAANIEKGGLYNHFPSKDALALAAFDYAVECVAERFAAAIVGRTRAIEQLHALVEVFQSYLDDPPLAGGCPVLNTAVEADDTMPPLRERAQDAMTSWHRLIGKIIKRGISSGELRADIDPYQAATILTASLEGAVMLSRLYGDRVYLDRVAAHLQQYICTFRAPESALHKEPPA